MSGRMRILIVADEVWNDLLHGNNVLTNWFTGFDAEFAEIYCSPGLPNNKICRTYFQVTDSMMVRSIIGKRAGRPFACKTEDITVATNVAAPSRFYRFMKSISSNLLLIVRDFIWLTGRYDKRALGRFIDDFHPDVIFCPRLLTPKLLRLERMISKMSSAPMIAFTGDDEASLREYSLSPFYWLRRLSFHWAFEKFVPHIYRYYFMHSREQAEEYAARYKIPTEVLFKAGDFSEQMFKKGPHGPIRMVYAGRLYCNRWKTLAAIGEALSIINRHEVRMVLDIYTQEEVSSKRRKLLHDGRSIFLNGRVAPSELVRIYKDSDIALHVESFDRKYRLATRVSFSTKIIDLMASSCAVMAICWEGQTGYRYLKEQDAAFCVSSENEILSMLSYIVEHPQQIPVYAEKAWRCGRKYHDRASIQKQIRSVFQKLSEEDNKIVAIHD